MGKGDTYRKVNQKRYEENYERIFGQKGNKMRCKWDILKEVNPSLISSADVLTACHCDGCTRERDKDKKIKKLLKENKKLKGG